MRVSHQSEPAVKSQPSVAPGLNHVPLIEPNAPVIPYLPSWSADRSKGAPAPDMCSGSPGG